MMPNKIFWGFLLICQMAAGQVPTGMFLSDSIGIGKPIQYALSYKHSPEQEVFFPDTAYNFYPFVLRNRYYLPTQTNKTGSLDSVVYTLETFEINNLQKLSLPVFVLTKRDCTAIYAPSDSVYLRSLLKGGLKTLALKADANPVFIAPQTDYAKILGYFLGTMALLGIISLFFGNYIQKIYVLFLFGRKHREFISNFKRQTRGTLTGSSIGKALILWKKHLEWLEKVPYSSFTTKEIIDHLPNDRLEEALRDVDTTIYGGILSSQMPFVMNTLQETATEQYKIRRKELSAQLS